ncbi:MAG: L-seryl-tRNA(Sec) selenium transferase [Syntrophobacterales bacterium]|nr:L-seryl-tRNA(Sec) selenium transferase [Syntrophobacterales bacterium]
MNDLLRQIPKIDNVLKEAAWAELIEKFPETLSKDILRTYLDTLRLDIRDRKIDSIPSMEGIVATVRRRVMTFVAPNLRRVINATGVIIHTNLGRSLLPQSAVDAITNAARHYVNLEYDLDRGGRGDRYDHCASILTKLTGCESALVVNNNSGAVFLILNTMAEGKEVVISRGELIEIGGSFRIPDVMKKSGAILREVGTTNRTYKEDYEQAIHENTAIIMKAHTSNYKIRGFTRESRAPELVALGSAYNVPTYFDAGSGLLVHFRELGIHDEPVIAEEYEKGFDIISFSGDKLPGAPQAGIIIGKAPYIEAMKKNPLARALRADKFTLAGLESTLLLYLDLQKARLKIPTLRMILEDEEDVKKRATRIMRILKTHCPAHLYSAQITPMFSEVGGGTLPNVTIPSFGIALKPMLVSTSDFEGRLRRLEIPIIARIEKNSILLNVRTVEKEDEAHLISGVKSALTDE